MEWIIITLVNDKNNIKHFVILVILTKNKLVYLQYGLIII